MVERKDETKTEEPKVAVQEVVIDMQLINNKLNYLINLLEKKD